ncbi:hypothetical protein J45TS6_48450 [Paenibacillus sp. J45TS6]|nr:hypothetical protein [Paenibacillus sp. J45TS6]GIP46386.1 hypothetical protein J45TS6_48450 [Paenibacillus sp. J45TS6]
MAKTCKGRLFNAGASLEMSNCDVEEGDKFEPDYFLLDRGHTFTA